MKKEENATVDMVYFNEQFMMIDEELKEGNDRTEIEDLYIYVHNSSKCELLDLQEKYQSCISNEIYENKLGIKPYAFDIFKKIK